MGFIAPLGGLFDMHSTRVVACRHTFCFWTKIFRFFYWSFLNIHADTNNLYNFIFKKNNLLLYFLAVLFMLFVIYSMGMFELKYHNSNISAWLALFKYGIFQECLYLGCGSYDWKHITDKGIIEDVGFYRILYKNGILWFLIYSLFVYKKSKSKLLFLYFWGTLLHYPVIFGLVNSALLGIIMNYNNRYNCK